MQNNAIYLNNNFLLILGVAVHSERLFSIAKADQGTRKLLVIRSREVAAPERLLYIEVIVQSGHVLLVII